MRNNICMVTALAMMLAIGSCREQTDYLVSYGQKDYLSFIESDTCFEGQFKALWTALNCNYGIWDHEAKFGLDWDDVYNKYLPMMQEFDKRDKETNPVTNDELKELYEEILGPLHDGHLYVVIINLHNTDNYSIINPANIRNASRPDYNIKEPTKINYYLTDEAGENKLEEYVYVSVKSEVYVDKEIQEALPKIMSSIQELQAIEHRTELQDYLLDRYQAAYQELSNFRSTSQEDLDYYNNTLTTKYQDLDITLNRYDISSDYEMDANYAFFSDGIVYLSFSNFTLTSYFSGEISGSPCKDYYSSALQELWYQWFNKVQDLHKAGQLKGVIIDVRCNGGGYTDDYQYALGALLPEGGHQISSLRTKIGVGRYDFSPLTPLVEKTLPTEHETITEPIVVLGNCQSASMAEQTCLGAKHVENARFIGMQTWGAMSALRPDPSSYSYSYAGIAGLLWETSFYAYIPTFVTVTYDGEILEGVGIFPDIEAPLDMDLYNTTGRDSQLERALQYIRTGN